MWEDFYTDNNIMISLPDIEITNIEESDILIVGSFIKPNEIDIILNYKNRKYLYITEPIGRFFKLTYDLYKTNIFDVVFGCVENNNNHIKFPIYNSKKYKYSFKDINEYVKRTNILKKNACCMIFSHDHGNTRTPIYNELKLLFNITCPGKLFNNSSNIILNKIGNDEYIKDFIFNICPENFICDFKGYITEKLMNCCMGGAIPIYIGHFDEIDGKIFNKNRIIFYNKDTPIFIKHLLDNKQKLISFYQQDVFMPEANITLINMTKNLKSKL